MVASKKAAPGNVGKADGRQQNTLSMPGGFVPTLAHSPSFARNLKVLQTFMAYPITKTYRSRRLALVLGFKAAWVSRSPRNAVVKMGQISITTGHIRIQVGQMHAQHVREFTLRDVVTVPFVCM